VYAHDEPDAVAAQQYLPDDLHGRTDYYRPTDRGFEAQRVWKRQPLGGLMGLGTSPSSRMRLRLRSMTGSGMGTAESSAWV
jgi:hypothetical protein